MRYGSLGTTPFSQHEVVSRVVRLWTRASPLCVEYHRSTYCIVSSGIVVISDDSKTAAYTIFVLRDFV